MVTLKASCVVCIGTVILVRKLKGVHRVAVCDRACESCQGDGPDMCDTCAEGYTLKDNVCVGMYTHCRCYCLSDSVKLVINAMVMFMFQMSRSTVASLM